jgi:hypothetical protein
MVSAVWEIAAALDEQRVPAAVPNAVWLEILTLRIPCISINMRSGVILK